MKKDMNYNNITNKFCIINEDSVYIYKYHYYDIFFSIIINILSNGRGTIWITLLIVNANEQIEMVGSFLI